MRTKGWWRGGRSRGEPWIRSNGKLNVEPAQGCTCVQLFAFSPDGEGWGPVGGACVLCTLDPVPGICQEPRHALCQQMYTKILKSSIDRSPRTLSGSPFSSSYGTFLDRTSHLEHDRSLCWQPTLERRRHEFWSQTWVQAWPCKLPAMAVGLSSYFIVPALLSLSVKHRYNNSHLIGLVEIKWDNWR